MARRRRRGLGSSDEVHRAAANRIADVAIAEAENARSHLAKGDCGAAIRALGRASFAAGRTDTHDQSSRVHGFQHVKAMMSVKQAQDAIVAACKVR
jgi:hypothetical protein